MAAHCKMPLLKSGHKIRKKTSPKPKPRSSFALKCVRLQRKANTLTRWRKRDLISFELQAPSFKKMQKERGRILLRVRGRIMYIYLFDVRLPQLLSLLPALNTGLDNRQHEVCTNLSAPRAVFRHRIAKMAFQPNDFLNDSARDGSIKFFEVAQSVFAPPNARHTSWQRRNLARAFASYSFVCA